LPEILEDAENGLSGEARALFKNLQEQIVHLDEQVTAYDRKLPKICQAQAVCQKLTQIPGIGPMTATARVAAVGDGRMIDNARGMPAWLGLVPRQESSGGKPR
jgi:transposase